MSRSLLPWVVPLVLVLAVVAFAIGGEIALLAVSVIVLAGLAAVRLRYLKDHPPDPELVSKPFWKF
jgi:hypothetical protein